MVAGRELDALVGQAMGLDVRGWALAYIDEMSCWCIEHPDEPGRGDPEDLRAVHAPRGLLTVCYLDEIPEEEDKPYWAARDEEDVRRVFKRDMATWGTSHDALEAVPEYSTSIAAAWQVVEKLTPGRHERMTIVFNLPHEPGGSAEVSFWAGEEGLVWARGESVPHAICEAAIKSVSASIPLTAPEE